MRIFKSLFRALRGRTGLKETREPTAGEQWREAFAVAFSVLVLEKTPISSLVEALPPETRDEVMSTGFDEVEARIFDLWLVSHALRRSVKHITQPDLLSILDAGHLEVYRQLLGGGMAEDQIMTLQRCLAQRYAEYDDAYGRFWAGEENWMLPLARIVTSYVFRRESSNARVAATLALAVVNPTVISIGKTFGEFRPPTSNARP